jgi:hypothetical protein
VKQAGLVETLSGAGPFTVFAPTDDAFAQVPAVTRDGWMRPAQKEVLAGVLKYHVVPGKLTAADLTAKITEGGGKAVLKTADGQDLTATKSGEAIVLTSASGNKATVTAGRCRPVERRHSCCRRGACAEDVASIRRARERYFMSQRACISRLEKCRPFFLAAKESTRWRRAARGARNGISRGACPWTLSRFFRFS